MKTLVFFTIINMLALTGFSQTVNINDCTDEVLVEVGNKYSEFIGKKIHLYSMVHSKRKAKIISVTLTPTKCSDGTVTLDYRPRKVKDMKFYSMKIRVKENGKVSTYTIGYQLYLAMLKSEKNRSIFDDKINGDSYQIAIDHKKNSLYLVSY